jgi:hypothetical protein
MSDVQKAQGELDAIAPAPVEAAAPPKSLDEVVSGLKGFGIEEFEEILTLRSNGKVLKLKISNIPTAEEMLAVQAGDDLKGYLWIKRVKVEIISRSITWVDGIDILNMPKENRFVPDPTDPNRAMRDIQVVLRNVLMGWGQEIVEILWKVVMNHSQNIEDRLTQEFPESAKFTDVEARLVQRARQELDSSFQVIRDEAVAALYDNETEKPTVTQ